MTVTTTTPQEAPRAHHPYLAALAVTAVGPTAALAAVPSTSAAAAPGAVTWSDDFNGLAGAAPTPASGATTSVAAAGATTSCSTTPTAPATPRSTATATWSSPPARRTRPLLVLVRKLPVHLGPAAHQRHVRPGVRAVRGAHQGAAWTGLWPAFWMLGNDIGTNPWPGSGEIDIMENVGYAPSTVWGTLHGPGYSGGSGVGASTSLPGGQALADAFHTFAVDWAPDSITWYLDGVAYCARRPPTSAATAGSSTTRSS
ncbi:family 16 glycosylhydrolase [Micromonospora sp. BRA006-A]|nr:family 16 glycosylhydrolase [Micromonospora sp. BRA006-A]